MFNFSFKSKSRSEGPKISGKGYIILNVIRVLNIISLLLAGAGSMIMLVRTVQTSNVSLSVLQTYLLMLIAIVVLFL